MENNFVNALESRDLTAPALRLRDVFPNFDDSGKDARDAQKKAFAAYRTECEMLAKAIVGVAFLATLRKSKDGSEKSATDAKKIDAYYNALRPLCARFGLKLSPDIANFVRATVKAVSDGKKGFSVVTVGTAQKAFEHAAMRAMRGESMTEKAIYSEIDARKAAKAAEKAEIARRHKEADEKERAAKGRTNEAENVKETIEAANAAGKAEQPAA